MPTTKEVKGVDILKAIDLANAVRSVGKFRKIKNLLPGTPVESSSCVLANTFNCDCEVKGVIPNGGYFVDSDEKPTKTLLKAQDKNGWAVYFKESKYAEALAKELKTKVYKVWDEDSPTYLRHSGFEDEVEYVRYMVLLPHKVGEIARKFDEYKLPSKFYKNPYDKERAKENLA